MQNREGQLHPEHAGLCGGIARMEANGYEPAAPMFNICHVSPHVMQNPDAFVAEIAYPVKKKYATRS